MRRLGIISAYPDDDWDARRIVEAAAEVAEAVVLSPVDFGAHVGPGRARRLTVRGEDARAYHAFLTPRAVGDAGDVELQLELYRTLAESGAVMVNDVRALTLAIDKFKSSWCFARAGLPTPEVVVTQRLDEAERALDGMGRAVFKPPFGSLGIGVELIDAGADGNARLAELLTRHRALYLQRFVAGVRRDLRVFVVGERVEAAVARRPRAGEFRGNLSQGAELTPVALEPVQGALAVAAARAVGLEYSGVDLLVADGGALVIEVNGTPSFRGLVAATGHDVARAIVVRALALGEEKHRGPAATATAHGEARWP